MANSNMLVTHPSYLCRDPCYALVHLYTVIYNEPNNEYTGYIKMIPPLQQNSQRVQKQINNISKHYQNVVLTQKKSSIKNFKKFFQHL